MEGVVIFGVGSPLVVDVEEACGRLGVPVAAAVRNVDGASYVSDRVAVVEADDVPAELLRLAVVTALFTPGHRKLARDDARRRGFAEVATVVDPTSVVASTTTLGAGVFVNAGCTIGGASTVAPHALVNRGASLGHHADVGELASIGPGAVLAGGVTLGRGAVIGAGAVILPEVEIGANAVVGAGAVVTRAVAANTVVLGNPARVARTGIAGFNGVGV